MKVPPIGRRGLRFQRYLEDVLRVMASPSIWAGNEPETLVTTLLEGALGMLRLEFSCLRLSSPFDGISPETSRVYGRADPALEHQLSRAVDGWLSVPSEGRKVVPNPFGPGRVTIACLRLGIREARGTLVVGARRAAFPTRAERALLQVAVSQVVIGLDEVRRSAELEHGIAEHARSERERLQLASIVENSGDFIGLASPAGRCWFINVAGQKLVGLRSDDEVRGTNISDYVTTDEQWKIEHQILPTVARFGRWDGELCFRHFATGAKVPMLAHVFSVREPGTREPMGLATISRDITERKQAEAELVALRDELAVELNAMIRLHEFSTRQLAKGELPVILGEVLSATMALQNADFGTVQLYNAASRAPEIGAQNGFDGSLLEHVRRFHEASAFGRAIVHGRRITIEDVMIDERVAAHRALAEAAGFRAVQSTPLFSSTGKPLGVLSTHFRRPHHPMERDLRFTDLYAQLAAQAIEREQTQAALRRSELHLAEAQRISHTGSWVWNMTTHEVLWSDEHCRIFGFAPGNSTPTHDLFWATVHPEDRAFTRKRIDKAVAERRDLDERFRLARLDGSVRHVHCVGHPASNDAGDLVEYVGAIVDVTERKLAEQVARRAEHDLARVGRAMTTGQFTATITHEMSQSLAAVVLSADACVRWLAANPPNLAEVEASVRRIARDAHRASEVLSGIRSLLTGSKPQKSRLSTGDILPDVVSLIQGKARAGGVQVFVSAPKELPTFSGDRIQLQQVLVNLALNAIEAMRSVTGRPRRLDIGVAQHGDAELRFDVRDSGPGLDSTQRHRVFDAFVTTKEQGMGMGLAICRSIVQAHGGRLWVEPNAGPGETFQFTLPLFHASA